MLVLMHVHLVDQRHNEVNNSVGVHAGRLSLRYTLIYIAFRNDRRWDGEARGMKGMMKEWINGRLEGCRGRGEVIEEPRPEGQPSPICIQGKSMNIHTVQRWMNE